MTPMPELSPAALAVRDAAEKQTDLDFRFAPAIAAAALQAAADQPYEIPPWYRGDDYRTYRDGADAQRRQLLAIAAELKAQ